MKYKRIFLMILDSIGVGESSDAVNFGDIGANTLKHVNDECDLFIPNLKKIGFITSSFNLLPYKSTIIRGYGFLIVLKQTWERLST